MVYTYYMVCVTCVLIEQLVPARPPKKLKRRRPSPNGDGLPHILRPIDTHLALYTMLYNNSAKNRYAEPVYNKTMKIFKIRD